MMRVCFPDAKVFTKPRFSKIAVYHSLSNGYGLGYGLGAYAPGPTFHADRAPSVTAFLLWEENADM